MTLAGTAVLALSGVTTGLMGFLVVLALVLACVFLFRSMAKHLRKVPPSFDEPPPPDDATGPKP
jgi:hypothetical protein